jgi:hypothetical protein
MGLLRRRRRASVSTCGILVCIDAQPEWARVFQVKGAFQKRRLGSPPADAPGRAVRVRRPLQEGHSGGGGATEGAGSERGPLGRMWIGTARTPGGLCSVHPTRTRSRMGARAMGQRPGGTLACSVPGRRRPIMQLKGCWRPPSAQREDDRY